ncbi:class I SAM-dependent methyltransferase [Microbispora sp. GKU 823]|uniref:class I SAM-dependent methyltransferase n=1 Tax=Microbispora sp. GKU 823 TaxID=1652100 RepID=UPI0009A3BE89|nr:class I SAM-dependent methyltransferase [Microbispora sp. GKU 823]
MTDQAFTPALGRFAPTRFYDPVVMLTRERLWRALTVMHVAPRPEDVIVEVGCGTGSTALLLNRTEPRARVVATDPDQGVLAIARRKAEAVGATVRWETGTGDALPEIVGAGAADTAVSTLVLYHPMPHHGRHHKRHGAVTDLGGVHHGGFPLDGDDLEGGVAMKAAVPRRPLIEGVAVTDIETRRRRRLGEVRCGVHEAALSSSALGPAAPGYAVRHRRVVRL